MKKKERKKILALIGVRSGSTGLKNKNILNLSGKPLMSWIIKTAKKIRLIDRVIVSTDSKKYQRIARKYGAETPFLRPKSISGSTIVTSGPVHCAVKRAKIPVGGPCATRHGKFNE